MQARFAFLCFKAWWICFFIGLTILAKFTMIFQFVWFVVLDALWTLDSTWKYWVTPFPAIFILWDSRISISSSDCCYILSNIEALINEILSFCTALGIPDVDLYDSYIQFRGCFDYSWFERKYNIIKNMILLDNKFNITWGEIICKITVREVGDAYNLEIGRENLLEKSQCFLNFLHSFWWLVN